MTDIQIILNTILQAVYGKDVRQAIVDGINQCYADTSEGVTPVFTISRVASATRVTITIGGNEQYFDIPDGISPAVNTANTAADMTDANLIYVYTGSETGYTAGHFYYYDPLEDEWVDGGEYQSSVPAIDSTLTQAGAAADAKAVGDKFITSSEISEVLTG